MDFKEIGKIGRPSPRWEDNIIMDFKEIGKTRGIQPL